MLKKFTNRLTEKAGVTFTSQSTLLLFFLWLNGEVWLKSLDWATESEKSE